MDWTPDQVSQDYLHDLRNAAEQAWGDDTRHEAYTGHPQPSAGQCYVTSRWLASKLGGHVGVKSGHYFWVSPDKSHVIDLTGDQFAYPPADISRYGIKLDEDDSGWEPTEDHTRWRPGPVLYKRADHPLYRGFRIKSAENDDPRVGLFAQRADQYLQDPTGDYRSSSQKLGLDYFGEPYPAETPQAVSDANQRYLHDEPDHQPGSAEYNFVWANGQLHVSPHHDHESLLAQANVKADYEGPVAVGYANVGNDKVNWSVQSNVALHGLVRILQDYSKQVGWKWGGVTDTSGNPIHDDFEERKARILRDEETGEITRFWVQGKTAYVNDIPEEAQGAIKEAGFRLAEYPGGTDMNDRLRNYSPAGEDYEQFNLGDPSPTSLENAQTDRNGVFTCKHCGEIFGSFDAYAKHLRTEEPLGYDAPEEHGGFPEVADPNLGPQTHYHEWEPINTIATVLPVASYKEASRVEGFNDYAPLWGFDNDEVRHYVAYQRAEPVGYASVRPTGEVVMVQVVKQGRGIGQALAERLKLHYNELWTTAVTPQGEKLARKMGMVNTEGQIYKWSAGSDPKDMINAPVPFIYDVQKDDVFVGQPGQRHADIRVPGQFTPGGIVEGTYEPGGVVTIRSMTNMPYSTRHLLDLWYWTHPHMEITKLNLEDAAGNVTKLASDNVGPYIKQLAATDPAAWRAYQALSNAGGEVYVVGGAVRDALLGRQPKDIDLMVRNLPADKVNQILSDEPGKVDLTGKDFGVFRYRHKGSEVEIALPRTETSTGSRRVDFDVKVDHRLPVSDDLLRRDFTVNSMAVDLNSGQLVDPYGGADDIKNRRLDTTHEKSFEEDPTRLVRALVASSRHGLTPTEKTRHEMQANAHRLDGEARERIQAELDKLFASSNPAGAIRLAQETGVLKHIFPEVANNFDFDQNNPHHNYKLGDHLLNVLENVSKETNDPDLRLAGLLHDIGKPASAWTNPDTGYNHYYRGPNGQGDDHHALGASMVEKRLRGLKYPVARINRVTDLVHHHMFPAFSSHKGARKFLANVGDHADDLLTLRWADQHGKGQSPEELNARTSVDTMRNYVNEVRSSQSPTNKSMISVNGNDLLAMGLKPGPDVGRILSLLTNDVIEDPALNDRERLLSRAQEYVNAVPR